MNSPVSGAYWYIGSGPSSLAWARARTEAPRRPPAAPRRGRPPRRRGGEGPPPAARWCSQASSHRANSACSAGVLRVHGGLAGTASPSGGAAGAANIRRGAIAPLQVTAAGCSSGSQRRPYERMSSIRGTRALPLSVSSYVDPGRDLGIGAALDDSLLLQRPQAQREGARADPLERSLELAEAQRVVGEVANDEEGPLAGDDLRRAADRTALIEHPCRIAPKLYFLKRLLRLSRGRLRADHPLDPHDLEVVGLVVDARRSGPRPCRR